MCSAKNVPTSEELNQILENLSFGTRTRQIAPEQWDCRERVAVRAVYNLEELAPPELETTPAQREAVQKVLAESIVTYPTPEHPAWQLRHDLRRETLRRLAEQGRLQETLAKNPSSFPSSLQDMLSAYILATAPALKDQTLDQLEATLQVTEWLVDCRLDLPAPVDIRRRLAHERLLKPFRFLVGNHFHGREKELATLRGYVNTPTTTHSPDSFDYPDLSVELPILISGPGGMGKSTLIAKFILEYAERENTKRFPYVYIDFNRRDVDIQNPISILMEAARQIAIEYPLDEERWARLRQEWQRRSEEINSQGDVAFTQQDQIKSFSIEEISSSNRREWERFLQEFLAALSNLLAQDQPLLMVLDTLEELLYHNREYLDGLWLFLNTVKQIIPGLRVVLSGRVRLPDRFPVRLVPLNELDLQSAIDLLLACEIQDEHFAHQIVDVVGRSPLSLWLAAGLYKRMGGDQGTFDNLEARQEYFYKVKEYLIQGLLYRRILGHIHDERVRALAHPGMVLRRITPELIWQVLAGPCKIAVKDMEDATQLFTCLQAEVALVEINQANPGELRQRPELRQAMLELLLQDDRRKVKAIHQAAIAYFHQRLNTQLPPDPHDRADETYHRLAMEEDPSFLDGYSLAELQQIANDLGSAICDLPVNAQTYLVSRVKVDIQLDPGVWDQADLKSWELRVARSVQNLLILGRYTDALQELNVRKGRTVGSPLYPLEVLVLVSQGKNDLARQILEEGIRRTPPNSIELHDLLVLSTSVDEKDGRLSEALQNHRRALAIATKLDQRVAVLRDQLSILRLSQSLFATNAPEIQQEHAALVKAWDNTGEDDLLSNPSLIRLVAAQIGGEVEVIQRAVRLVGLGTARPANLENLASALTTWDDLRSTALNEPAGVFIRQARGGPDSWLTYLQNSAWEPVAGFLLSLIETQPLSVPMAITLADLIKARLLLTRQQAEQLQGILTQAFATGELEDFVCMQYKLKLSEVSSASDPQRQAADLISWAESNGNLAQLLQGLISERPNEPQLAALLLSMGIDYRPSQSFSDPAQAVAYYQSLAETAHNRGDVWAEGAARSELARILVERGQLEQAAAVYQQVVQVQTGLFGSDHPNVAAALSRLGEVRMTLGKLGEAQSAFEQALHIDEAFYGPDHPGTAPLANNLGIALYNLGKISEAMPYFERALKIARQGNDHAVEGSALGNLGDAYYTLGEIEKAVGMYEQRLAIAKEVGDRSGEMHGLNNLGMAERQAGNTLRTQQNFEQALAIAQELGDRAQEAQALSNLGLSANDHGNTTQAIQLFKQSLAIFKDMGDRLNEITLLNNLGLAYGQMKELERARDYFEESLAGARAAGDRRMEGVVLNNLGLITASMGETQKAITYYTLALGIAHALGNRQEEGNALGNLGLAYEKLEDYTRAEKNYQRQIEIAREIKDTRGLMNGTGNLANSLYIRHQYRKAVPYFQEALGIAQRLGDREPQANFCFGIGLCSLETAQLDQAIQYLKMACDLFKTLDNPKSQQAEDFLQKANEQKTATTKFVQGHALLIGVGTYDFAPWLDVPVTVTDARRVRDILANPNLAGYPARQITLLQDQNASRNGILQALDELAKATHPDDTVFIYYAGHIGLGTDGNYYLTACDTRFSSGRVGAGSGIAEEELLDKLHQISAQHLIFFCNSCHTGPLVPHLERGKSGDFDSQTLPGETAAAILGSGPGRVIISACGEEQQSWIGNDGLSLFAQALVDGLSGKGGVRNNAGYIGAFGLYEHLYETVKEATADLGHLQEPELTVLRGTSPFPVALYRGAATHTDFDATETLPPEAPVRKVSGEKSRRQFERWISKPIINVSTGGGAYILGGINTSVGDFVGRDKNTFAIKNLSPLQNDLEKLAPAVCLVEMVDQKGSNLYSTAFLIGPDLLLTAYPAVERVLDGSLPPENMVFRFDLLVAASRGVLSQGESYALAAGREAQNRYESERPWLMAADQDLHYALLRLARPAGAEGTRRLQRGWLRLQAAPSLRPGDTLGIIHYRRGLRQTVTFEDNSYLSRAADGRQLFYQLNTEPGSAGAPIFNTQLQVVGMHLGENTEKQLIPPPKFGLLASAILDSVREKAPEVFKDLIKGNA